MVRKGSILPGPGIFSETKPSGVIRWTHFRNHHNLLSSFITHLNEQINEWMKMTKLTNDQTDGWKNIWDLKSISLLFADIRLVTTHKPRPICFSSYVSEKRRQAPGETGEGCKTRPTEVSPLSHTCLVLYARPLPPRVCPRSPEKSNAYSAAVYTLACEQALLFGRAKRVSREHAFSRGLLNLFNYY